MKERRKQSRVPISLPLEYWETDDACHGGLVGNLSEMGVLVYSIRNIPIDTQLSIRVFFIKGYELDGFQARARIVWREDCFEENRKAYHYGLEFTGISQEDRHKLVSLLNSCFSSTDTNDSVQSGYKDYSDRKECSSDSPRMSSPVFYYVEKRERKDTKPH
jgi:c-di-GMP-binding flagellar brake protein YcgR